jgi:serine phosphatase RsbU (regulator of sigma subunit)
MSIAGDAPTGSAPTPVPVAEFDRYARLAAALTGAPTSVVGFQQGGRRVFLGAAGLPGDLDEDRSMPIEETLCTRVVESGQPLVVADARLVPDLADHPAVAAHGLVGYAGFPVRGADGRAVAALCAIEYGPREWDARTLEVLADLAAACSTEVQLREQQEHTQAAREAAERSDAVTSALLEERRGVAHTLQVAMLTDLPRAAGLALEAVYAPASATEDVGGDWYDAMVLADGGVALAVGDITGHDTQAAAIMGQMRSMLRALWWEHDKPPSRILRLLDEASVGTGLAASGTALLARVEPARGTGVRRLQWSSAGHPVPVVARADGTVEVPGGRPDMLLGFTPGCHRTDRWVDLAAGDTLVLFTDGLIERRGESLAVGIERLVVAVRDGSRTPEQLLAVLAPQRERRDDVVVLTATVLPHS